MSENKSPVQVAAAAVLAATFAVGASAASPVEDSAPEKFYINHPDSNQTVVVVGAPERALKAGVDYSQDGQGGSFFVTRAGADGRPDMSSVARCFASPDGNPSYSLSDNFKATLHDFSSGRVGRPLPAMHEIKGTSLPMPVFCDREM